MEGVKDYFLEAIESYILDLDRKEITKDSYKRTLLRFSAYLKSRSLLIPKSRNIIEYKEHLSKSVGASSIQKAVVVLRGFFVYLAKNDLPQYHGGHSRDEDQQGYEEEHPLH